MIELIIKDPKERVLVADKNASVGYEISGDELISAIALYINTKREMEDINND